MKKMKDLLFLITLFFTFTTVPVSAQKDINLDFNIDDYHIINSNSILHIESQLEGLTKTENISEPALPYHPLRILIPQNTDEVPFSFFMEKTIIYDNIDMEANPAPMTTNGVKIPGNRIATTSVTSPVVNNGIVNYGGGKYLYLKITPFIYDKDARQLCFVNHIRLSFPTLSNNNSTINTNDLPLNYKSIAERVCNANDILGYYPIQISSNRDDEEPVDYLIITCDSLVENFSALTEWKNRKGLYTKVISVESLYEGHSNLSYYEKGDLVKGCLYDYHSNYGTKWVLLGGDDTIVPVRLHTVLGVDESISNSPADLFYATFTPFIWPEYTLQNLQQITDFYIDLNPEVYVSRLPIRNSNDVLNFTNKLLEYERDIPYPEPYGRLLMTG